MFSSLNYKLLGLSLVLLIAGYVLLGQGPVTNPLSLNLAPIVLVAVYLFLIPFAIIVRGKEGKK
jgi:uncharacterized membrane protein